MISFQQISFLRGVVPVLHDFSATLSAGQGAWLTGPNGCGKSSLLRAAAGLLPVLAGEVRVQHEKIFIGTALGHDASLSCADNLRFWCAVNNVDGIDVASALAQAGLAAFTNRHVTELSAGLAQRLALTRLTCSPAKVWLLDEPFSALDAPGQVWLRDLLASHLQRGGAALVATHHIFDVPGMTTWEMAA